LTGRAIPGTLSITVTPTSLTFGDVPINSSSTKDITIQNNGDTDLQISNISINGDGFTLQNATAPITVSAGGTRTFAVQFLPTAITNHSGTITLTHNAIGGSSTINLIGTGVGVAVPSMTITPILDFNDVLINFSSSKNITIQNNGDVDLQISNISINGNGFTVQNATAPIIVVAGGSRNIAVQFTPTVTGYHSGTIILTHNANGGLSMVQLTGRCVPPTTPEIIVIPNPLAFGDVLINSSWSQNIIIQNNGTADLEISGVSISGDGFTLPDGESTIKVPAGEYYSLWVQFSPTVVGTYSGTITLKHNTIGGLSMVQLTGRCIPPATPGITVVPNPLAFNNVLIYSSSTQNITIRNNGTAHLEISNISISGNGFILPNDESSILVPAGQSSEIYVQFSPAVVGTHSGTITLTHNATDLMTTINLIGTGIAPNIAISSANIDFGGIQIDSWYINNITIYNSGDADLEISEISISGDGFILPNDESSILVPAGQYHDLYVQFSPTVVGPYAGIITFEHNANGSPTTINLTGTGVVPKITVTPNSLAFGDVLINSSSSQDITIENNGTANLVISKVSISGGAFTLQNVTTPINVKAGENHTITVQLLPTVIGSYTGTVTLEHNAEGSPSTINLTGTGIAVPRITITPDTLGFGNVLTGKKMTKFFDIRNVGAAPLVVSRFVKKGNDDEDFIILDMDFPVTIIPDESTTFYVEFTPSINGEKSAILVIEHNAIDSPDTLYLHGKGVSPKITIIDSLDFGSVLLGSSDTKTITIKNDGDGPLIITSLATSSVFFTLPNGEDTIAIKANSSYDLKVQFSPTATTNYTGIITLTHNATATGTTTAVKLSGNGIISREGYDIAFDTDIVNFGSVGLGNDAMKGYITVSNPGTKTISVTGVEIVETDASMFVWLDGESITIESGDSYTFNFEFLPTSAGEKNAKAIFTHTLGVTEIKLIGIGLGTKIAVEPEELEFGDIQFSSYQDLQIVIENSGTNNLRVTKFEISGANKSSFSVLDAGSITILPSDRQTAMVRFRPEKIGIQSAELSMFYTGSIDPVIIPLSGNGLPTVVTLEPQDNTEYDEEGNIDFGEVSAGDAVGEEPHILQYITIKNTDEAFANRGVASLKKVNSDITITNLEIVGRDAAMFRRVSIPDSSDFKPITIQSGSQFVFTFEFAPETPGEKQATTIFTHDLGSTDIGFVAQALLPVITFLNENIFFSDVEINTYKDLPVVIQNTGNADLKFSSLKIGGESASSFSLVLDPESFNIVIVPTDTYTNAVRFKPDIVGRKTATLEVSTNIGDKTITLSGNAIPDQTISVEEPDDIMDGGSTFLFQNNPNPVRSGYNVAINYKLNTTGQINLTLYDILGREVAKIVDDYKSAGVYSVNFNTKGLPSGVYFYKLRAPGYEGLKKMMIVR
jgi:archaellum component FlaF (FlaF/FlaG flagellin family)